MTKDLVLLGPEQKRRSTSGFLEIVVHVELEGGDGGGMSKSLSVKTVIARTPSVARGTRAIHDRRAAAAVRIAASGSASE